MADKIYTIKDQGKGTVTSVPVENLIEFGQSSSSGGGSSNLTLEQARKNGNVLEGNIFGNAEFNKQGDRLAFAQLSDLYDNVENIVSGFQGSITPASTPPTGGWIKGFYMLRGDGAYPNAGNIVAEEDKLNFGIFNGTSWELNKVDVPASVSISTDEEFRERASDKSMSPAQLFNEVIGDFAFNGVDEPLTMTMPYVGFNISNPSPDATVDEVNQWFYDDVLTQGFQRYTGVDIFFTSTGAKNVYIYLKSDKINPVAVIPVEVSVIGVKRVNFPTKYDATTHLVAIGGGVRYSLNPTVSLAYNITHATGNATITPQVVLHIILYGEKTSVSSDRKIVERLNDIEDSLGNSTGTLKVFKGSSLFPTINSAIQSVKNSSGKKIIEVFPGVYDESIDLYKLSENLEIQIIGIGRGVKVVQHFGDYYRPPMQVNCNAYFENIIFESTQDISLLNPSSYAVHSDINFDDTHYPCTIEYFNCEFINKVNNQHTYGAGSWTSNVLRFRNCVFRKKNTLEVASALYWHNAVANSNFNQQLEVINCELYSDGGFTLILHDANQTVTGNNNGALSSAKVMFVNNTFYSGNKTNLNSFSRIEGNRKAGALIGNIFLDERSHGNNILELNY